MMRMKKRKTAIWKMKICDYKDLFINWIGVNSYQKSDTFLYL